jgi:excisionase family DNA binding protein
MQESQLGERCTSPENRIPQHGWVLDIDLANALGVSRETLVDWLHKYRIDHSKPGCRILIRMETFFAGLPSGLTGETKRKK